MNAWTKLGCLMVIVGSVGPNARAQTEVCGRICENTKWSGTIVVTCDVEVCCDKTLTVNPGTEVRFEPGTELRIGCPTERTWGTLIARGNADARIVFTSNAAEPAAGDWKRILFTDFAVDASLDETDPENIVYLSGSILEYTEVQFAGDGVPAVGVDKTRPYLNHCKIHHSAHRGLNIDGTLTHPQRIENCEIWNCHAPSWTHGGGISLTGAATALLRNNHVHDCSSVYGDGGGIYVTGAVGVRLIGNTVERCWASDGGGILADYGSHRGVLIKNTVTGNTASWDGGGVYFYYANNWTLTSNTIAENVASDNGGGIYFYDSTGHTLNSSAPDTPFVVADNTAEVGGGMYFLHADASSLSDLSITENTASSQGGAVYLNRSDGNCITSTVISGNTAADDGGGLLYYQSNGCEVTESEITGNTAFDTGGAICIAESDDFQMCDSNVSGNRSVTARTGGIWVGGGSQRVSLSCGAEGLACGEPDPQGCNRVYDNEGCDVTNANPVAIDNDVTATCVWWGTCDPVAIAQTLCDCGDNPTSACVLWDPPAGGDCKCPPCVPPCTTDADCDDGLFCNGRETCNTSDGCCRAGDPVVCPHVECGDICNEEQNNCNTPEGTPCTADGNPCTADVCDGQGACGQNLADGTPCADGLFCNGEETCQGGVCVTGKPPCPPALCDEQNNRCACCDNCLPADLDCNGRIDLRDFASFQRLFSGP